MNQQTKCCVLVLPNGFRNCSFSKVFLCMINYTSIDRTDQDLSSEICFIIGTYSRMNQPTIYYILVSPSRFQILQHLKSILIYNKCISVDRTHRDLSNEMFHHWHIWYSELANDILHMSHRTHFRDISNNKTLLYLINDTSIDRIHRDLSN